MNVPGLELDPDLAKLYEQGAKYEVPGTVLADRCIQVQQLRMLAMIQQSLVALAGAMQKLLDEMPKANAPAAAPDPTTAPVIEPTAPKT